MIAVREFSTGTECIASAAAVRAKFFNPKIRPVIKTKPVEKVLTFIPVKKAEKPGWMLAPTMFDEHVVAYRTAMKIREMVEAGEIEMVSTDRKTVQQIVVEVLQGFPNISLADVKSSRRSYPVVIARQTAMYEVRQQRPDLSFPMIGRWFGGRDHTTVLHAVRKIEAMRGAK
ncbi:helix-turn-helix domain-containing protein [Xaviernesmea oryzae]|uniref:helix-turn-helix domain-containing protein n=1 Tax=Xaviernesmea oryzae TaxID=464029 RepID=UPI000A194FBE|nr:helix-turn-helix domain-containing protein [Xaviernesmea oryzae]